MSENPPRTLHALFVENGDALHIRKWSVARPFDGASFYVYAGRGDPLQPGDDSEHYPPEMLPRCLRFVAEHLPVECERHVIEDCIRICADAADLLDALLTARKTGEEK